MPFYALLCPSMPFYESRWPESSRSRVMSVRGSSPLTVWRGRDVCTWHAHRGWSGGTGLHACTAPHSTCCQASARPRHSAHLVVHHADGRHVVHDLAALEVEEVGSRGLEPTLSSTGRHGRGGIGVMWCRKEGGFKALSVTAITHTNTRACVVHSSGSSPHPS